MLSDLAITNEVYYFSIPPLLKFKSMIDNRLIKYDYLVEPQHQVSYLQHSTPIFHWLFMLSTMQGIDACCLMPVELVQPVLSLEYNSYLLRAHFPRPLGKADTLNLPADTGSHLN